MSSKKEDSKKRNKNKKDFNNQTNSNNLSESQKKSKPQSISDNLSNQQKRNEEQPISSCLSTPSIYIKPEENITNLLNIKNNLKIGKDILQKFNLTLKDLQEENFEISKLYANERELNNKIEKENNTLKLDNELFEYRAREIFSDVYDLKEKILYPYFSVEYSRNKKSNTIKIYYYKVEFKINNQNSTSFIFPDYRDTFLTYYEGFPILFQKNEGTFNNITLINKNYNNFVEIPLKKEGNIYQTSFFAVDICDEFLEIKGKANEVKNKLASLDTLNNNLENADHKEIFS